MAPSTKATQRVCPACGATITPIPIIYGMPGGDLFAESEAGRVQLGGCVVTGDDPEWACPECEEPIFDDGERERRYRRVVELDRYPS